MSEIELEHEVVKRILIKKVQRMFKTEDYVAAWNALIGPARLTNEPLALDRRIIVDLEALVEKGIIQLLAGVE